MDSRRFLLAATAATAAMAALSALPLPGLAAETVAYKCPGPPVLYTDQLTPQQAKERGCTVLEGASVTVIQSVKPRAVAASGARGDARVEASEQRARDQDARRILADELKREEDRLAQLQVEYNNGEPERRGDERNYQKYLDRVAEMKASIQRKEADIAALKREMAKLPQ